jgi:hypothetical protein
LRAVSVPEFWQQAINGALLIVAIAADRVVTVRRERAARAAGPGGGGGTGGRGTTEATRVAGTEVAA